jgi:hypothetical protein
MEQFWSRMMIRSCGILLCAGVCGAASAARAAVTISSDATQNMTCSAGVCTPTAAEAVLNVTDLENLLSSGNVEVTTTGSGVQASDVEIMAALSWTAGNSLTLDAYRSIGVDQPVSVNGSGAVSLVTDDGGRDGTLSFVSGGSLSFTSTANSLSIDGKAYLLVDSIAALAADIAELPSGRYALSANYDASQEGPYRDSPILNKFKGTFNGLGNTISNLAISSGKPEIGLFAYVDTKGTISSLLLTNASITARDVKPDTSSVAAILAAVNYGTVFNSLAGGQITDTARRADVLSVGGLIGDNEGVIAKSGASATVYAVGRGRYVPNVITGGLASENSGTIAGSYATGSVSANAPAYAGGLVGIDGGTVENCYAEGNVSASGSYSYVGGLVGFADTSSTDNSYSTGSPSAHGGSNVYVGGVLGYDDNESDQFSDDYWDTTTSGITKRSQGAGNIRNDPGIKGKTTAELQSGLPKGFDPKIWAENPKINGGLPYLIANPPQ